MPVKQAIANRNRQPKNTPETGKLFSTATESYVNARLRQNPRAGVSSIRCSARLFMDIFGNKVIEDYEPNILQKFIDQVQFYPPHADKHDALAGKSTLELIKLNKRHKYGMMAFQTLKNGHLAAVRGVFKEYFYETGKISHLMDEDFRFPAVLVATKKHKTPSAAITQEVFRLGCEAKHAVDLLLPLLCYGTGRRLGLLSYLQAENIKRDENTGIVYGHVPATFETADGVRLAPVKNNESTGKLVIPQFVVDCGLMQWVAIIGRGFIFRQLHEAKDPADAASKRLQVLLKKAKKILARTMIKAGYMGGVVVSLTL